jgi:hypothetical protein
MPSRAAALDQAAASSMARRFFQNVRLAEAALTLYEHDL